MHVPRVSVITPSFQQAAFLEQTIKSVLSQQYPNLEYWVIDGGSTDGSVEILKKYQGKLNWVSEKDNGQTDAINKGLALTSGDIVMYINSDDVMLPGTIRKVVHAFEQHPHALWLTGDYRIIDQYGRSREGWIVFYKRLQRDLMRVFPLLQPILLGINNPIAQPSTWWRRESLKKVGTFTTDLRFTMDYEFWLRLLKHGNVLVVTFTLSAFRVHSLSKGGTSYQRQMAEQLKVATVQGVHPILLRLQALHNVLIIFVYRWMR